MSKDDKNLFLKLENLCFICDLLAITLLNWNLCM